MLMEIFREESPGQFPMGHQQVSLVRAGCDPALSFPPLANQAVGVAPDGSLPEEVQPQTMLMGVPIVVEHPD